jgi:hypothetical protein
MNQQAGITIQKTYRKNDFNLVINYKKNPELVTQIMEKNNIIKPIEEYSQQFISKIRKGEQDLKNGKGVKISIEDLWK